MRGSRIVPGLLPIDKLQTNYRKTPDITPSKTADYHCVVVVF